MPRQDQAYRDSVLPKGVKRIAMEAAHPMSWYRWVGDDGVIIGIDRFGASAPAAIIYQQLGITVQTNGRDREDSSWGRNNSDRATS